MTSDKQYTDLCCHGIKLGAGERTDGEDDNLVATTCFCSRKVEWNRWQVSKQSVFLRMTCSDNMVGTFIASIRCNWNARVPINCRPSGHVNDVGTWASPEVLSC